MRTGEGGMKRGHFCGRPLWMTPKSSIVRYITCDYMVKATGL